MGGKKEKLIKALVGFGAHKAERERERRTRSVHGTKTGIEQCYHEVH